MKELDKLVLLCYYKEKRGIIRYYDTSGER